MQFICFIAKVNSPSLFFAWPIISLLNITGYFSWSFFLEPHTWHLSMFPCPCLCSCCFCFSHSPTKGTQLGGTPIFRCPHLCLKLVIWRIVSFTWDNLHFTMKPVDPKAEWISFQKRTEEKNIFLKYEDTLPSRLWILYWTVFKVRSVLYEKNVLKF